MDCMVLRRKACHSAEEEEVRVASVALEAGFAAVLVTDMVK